jgi:NADH-quinone oxidoreductase subunit G
MDVHLGLPDANAARRELNALVPDITSSFPETASAIPTRGAPAAMAGPSGRPAAANLQAGPNQAFLATWHNLLDAGRMQDGEPNLAATARAAVAKMSAATAAEAGVGDGGKVTVATERGTITVPAEIADMPDRVVWLPTNSAGCAVRGSLGAGHGSLVTVRSAQ